MSDDSVLARYVSVLAGYVSKCRQVAKRLGERKRAMGLAIRNSAISTTMDKYELVCFKAYVTLLGLTVFYFLVDYHDWLPFDHPQWRTDLELLIVMVVYFPFAGFLMLEGLAGPDKRGTVYQAIVIGTMTCMAALLINIRQSLSIKQQ
jgi:hypothetical protein